MAYLFGLTPPISNVFRSRLSPPKETPRRGAIIADT